MNWTVRNIILCAVSGISQVRWMFNLATCPWSLQKCKGGRGAAYHQSNFLLLLTSYTLCCNYLWLERPRLHKYVMVLSLPFHFICVNMCSVSLPCSFPLVQPCSLCFSTHSPHLCFSTPLHLHLIPLLHYFVLKSSFYISFCRVICCVGLSLSWIKVHQLIFLPAVPCICVHHLYSSATHTGMYVHYRRNLDHCGYMIHIPNTSASESPV